MANFWNITYDHFEKDMWDEICFEEEKYEQFNTKKMYKRVKKNHIQIFDGIVYYWIKINGNAVISNAFIQIFPIKINILE